MGGFPKLTRLAKSVDNLTQWDGAPEWGQLAGRDSLLEAGIREAVAEALAPDGLDAEPCLRMCLKQMSRAEIVDKIQAFLESEHEDSWRELDVGRLHRNSAAMLATGIAAVSAANLVSKATAEDALFECWREASKFMGGTVGASTPKFDSSQLEGGTKADSISRTRACLKWAYTQCTQLGWVVPGPYRWTLDWLDGSPGIWRTAFVKVAGVHTRQLPKSRKEPFGFLADFELELLSDDGGVLVEHPRVRLRPFDDEFLKGIEAAWRCATRATGKPASACWSLTVPIELVPPWQPLRGDSLSGAAARAFWYLVERKVPDEGVLVLACVDREAVAKGREDVLKEVDESTIHLKVTAAAEDPSIDTIVVAGEGNAGQVRNVLGKLGTNHKSPQGRIRVVTGAGGDA
jgi:hypothetical protein